MKPLGAVVLLVVGAAATFSGGWYGATVPDIELDNRVSARNTRAPVVAISNQNGKYNEAAVKLRELGLMEPEATVAAEPAPPKVDPRELLRRAVSAVIREGNSYVLVIVDGKEANGRAKRRKGDAFEDGWKFRTISPAEIVMTRADEEIRLPVMASALAEAGNTPSSVPESSAPGPN